MATAINSPKSILPTDWTLADLQDHLGGIPLERVRLFPPPGLARLQDAVDLDDHHNRLCELVDGILVEKAKGSYESILAGLLITELNLYLKSQPLGVVLGADGMLEILPDQVRIPDVSFLAWEKFPQRRLPRDPVFGLAPDLAVEVLSKSNTAGEMSRKVREYFDSGTRLVWLINPDTRTVDVYTAVESTKRLTADDNLTGDDVLPGFELPLGTLFDRFEQEQE